EHSISVATASGVLSAIDRSRYEVIPVGITKAGEFIPFNADPSSIALDKGLIELEAKGPSVRFELDGSKELVELDASGKEVSRRVVDVVFPLLHGPYGEDGTLQGFLEMAQLRYVGNGVLASAAAMDKEFSKALFKAAGIPSPDHVIVYKSQMLDDPESALEKIRSLGSFPVFVKPARAGSSVGITKVKAIDGIAAALESAFEHDDKAIIEVAVSGRELECGVLDGKDGAPLRVSVAGEIKVSGREFYDFEAKYVDKDSASLICPAALSEAELFEMQQLAKKAFRALGCKGLARVDFFVTEKGFMLSEINTMPGFTSISMFPRCWEQSGLSYSELIDELIELALEN
ncbi:MAG: D-alanine--D-alanine ligase family protein, partial [Actinomycetota bacterium]